jgi:hypothetical protein
MLVVICPVPLSYRVAERIPRSKQAQQPKRTTSDATNDARAYMHGTDDARAWMHGTQW